MKKLICLILVIFNLKAQDTIIPPRNKINVEIKSIVSLDTINGFFEFEYKIRNLSTSEQSVWMAAVILPKPQDTSKVKEITWPPLPKWDGICVPISYASTYPPKEEIAWVNWGSDDSTSFISPSDSLSGFSFKTYIFPEKKSLLPDIQDFYVEGYAPPPSFPEGEAPEIIHGYDDLTPYGPGKVYKTVGPGALPPGWWYGPDSSIYFVADSGFYHLIDRVNKCFEQGWLMERAKEHLIRILERGLMHYQNRRFEQAKRTLIQVMEYLERERGNLIFDEAFYILYYRTKFVKEHLSMGG